MKWEYHFILIDKSYRSMRDVFDAAGKDGWEMVGFYENIAWFKRRKSGIVKA